MITIKRYYGMANVRWIVWDSKNKSGDLVSTFLDALRIYIWRLGVPVRIAFFRFKGYQGKVNSN